jgi:hypothetical protein
MKTKNLIAIVMLLCSLSICSCKRDKGIICTMEYRTLTISIKDTASKPVLLSKYFVKKTSTGEIIDYSKDDSIDRIHGIYIVCTDGKMGMTSRNGTEFEFHGILGTTEIVNEKYLIGNDQCHVKMLSGKTEIVISK